MASRYPPLDLASAWMRYLAAYSQMSMAATEVIVRRSIRMSRGEMTGPEAVGMMMEKASAFASAGEKAAVAAARGSNPATIASAALQPIRAKARSNARKYRR